MKAVQSWKNLITDKKPIFLTTSIQLTITKKDNNDVDIIQNLESNNIINDGIIKESNDIQHVSSQAWEDSVILKGETSQELSAIQVVTPETESTMEFTQVCGEQGKQRNHIQIVELPLREFSPYFTDDVEFYAANVSQIFLGLRAFSHTFRTYHSNVKIYI